MSSNLITTETTLVQHAEEIRSLGKRTIANVIEIGRRLTESKKLCGHGNWLPWLEKEFDWDERTARRYISTYEFAGNSDKLSDLEIGVSSLYMLAAPSTPEHVSTEIIERVATGEKVTGADVREAKEKAKVKTKADRASKRPKKPKADVSAAADRAENGAKPKPSVADLPTAATLIEVIGQPERTLSILTVAAVAARASEEERIALLTHLARSNAWINQAGAEIAIAGGANVGVLSPPSLRYQTLSFLRKAIERIEAELAGREPAPGPPVRQNPPDHAEVPGADGPP